MRFQRLPRSCVTSNVYLNCDQEPEEDNTEVTPEQAAQVEAPSVRRGPRAGGVGGVGGVGGRGRIGMVITERWCYIGKSFEWKVALKKIAFYIFLHTHTQSTALTNQQERNQDGQEHPKCDASKERGGEEQF